jgi:Gpi18-like mannosyltransferase
MARLARSAALIGLNAPKFLSYKPSFAYFDSLLPFFGWPRWLYSWGGFDGVHYLNLARNGYVGTGLVQAFFPVWPGLMAIFHRSTGIDLLLTGLILSAVFGLGAVWLLWIAWQKLLGTKLANWSLAWWLVFPTSFFLTGIYTESLFIFLAVGCYLAARAKNWWLAAALAAVASGTRIVGIWVVPMLWLMALDGIKLQGAQLWAGLKKAAPVLLICSLGSLGLLGYMVY